MKITSRLIVSSIVLLITVFQQSVLATEKQIYLLSGCPTPKSDVKFPTFLYRIDKAINGLVKVRDVATKAQGTTFIRQYLDEGNIILQNKNRTQNQGNRTSEFAIIDMKTPELEKKFNIVYQESFSNIEEHIFNIPDKGLYQGIYLSRNRATETMLLAINLTTMKQEELPWDVYKYVKLSGIPGGATSGGDWLSTYANTDGRIVIPIRKQKIETNWKLPEYMKFSETDRIILFVNNNAVKVLSSIETRIKNKDGLGNTFFHVFDKKRKDWHSINIEGSKTGIRGFGLWLAGYVADEKRNVDSPGKERRRKASKIPRREDMAVTGTPVDWRFNELEIYCPGKLFLYNTHTRQKYSIETGQGDSEVLLVEDEVVYYRVNDEIYQAKISADKVEAGKLIAKDEVVPDIHWAFIRRQ